MRQAAARSLLTCSFFLASFTGPVISTAAAAVSVPGNYSTVQGAINAVLSGSLPDGTTIDVQPGVYYEALAVANTNRSFTVRGVGGAGATIIDASGRGAAALTIYRASGQIVFRGLTFRNAAPPSIEGGGFMIRESSPSLVNCIFESNSAFRGGGGALFASNATFTGCIIRNNSARHFGGGVYIVLGSRPVFTGCDIVSNASGTGGPGEGTNGAGGGVFSHDSSPTFRGVRVNANTSRFAAGGIFQMGVFGSGYGVATLLLEDSEVADNVSSQYSSADPPAEGGGMHVEDNATATLTRTRILRNRANTGGGLNLYRARYDLVDSAIESNVAAPTAAQPSQTGFGGGIAATSNNPSPPLRPGSVINLTRTLVRNNTATVTGGGIAVFGDNFSNVRASISLVSSVVSGNRSQSQGGGILVNRTDAALSDSIVIGNVVSGGAYPSGGGILITGTSGASITGTTIVQNAAGQYGGGIFVDAGSNLQMNGSRVYDNVAPALSGGGLFVGPGNTVGTVQNSIIADNTGYQIVEHACPTTILNYTNNTITPRAGNTDLYFTVCSLGPVTSVSAFNALNNTSGNNSNVPRFAHFLAAPAAGTRFTLAWSVARASSVSISGSSVAATGTMDVAPAVATTYSLTASTATGSIGPITAGVTIVQPPGMTPDGAVDGDFNGDGKADLTVFRPSNGIWYHLYSGGGTAAGYQWGNSSDVPVPADYDGDGRVDIAVFRPSNGVWYLRYSSTGATTGVQWGNGSDVPVPEDYDGDGRADIAVFRPSNGTWYLRYSATGTTAGFQWGSLTDRPVAADYDGDGRADLAVFRPSNGTWYLRYSSTGTTAGLQWGNSTDRATPGDYDGDGRTDVAVFRPSNGTWYLRYASTGTTAGFQWGNSTDVPVPGDYDGDGRTDLAVFRPSNGVWYLRYMGTGATAGFQWGNATDIPILRR